MRSISAIAITLLLAACADTTTRGGPHRPAPTAAVSCAQINWQQAGYQDGLRGATLAAYEQRVASCNPQYGRPDRLAYSTTRLKGLQQYCTVQTGYALGLKGAPVGGGCPANLVKALQQGYAKGVAARRGGS